MIHLSKHFKCRRPKAFQKVINLIEHLDFTVHKRTSASRTSAIWNTKLKLLRTRVSKRLSVSEFLSIAANNSLFFGIVTLK